MKKRYPLLNKSTGGGRVGSVTQPYLPVPTLRSDSCCAISCQISSVAEKSAEMHVRYVTCRAVYRKSDKKVIHYPQSSGACPGQSREFHSTCVYIVHVKHTIINQTGIGEL